MGGETFLALVQRFPASGQQMVYCHRLTQDTTGLKPAKGLAGLISLVWMSPLPPFLFVISMNKSYVVDPQKYQCVSGSTFSVTADPDPGI
jgi:hypothetical protein